MDTKELLQVIAIACDEKNAENLIALDMQNISLIADYFLICHANNPRQTQAIAEAVKKTVEEKGIIVKHMEGYEQGKWIIIDTGAVLCHIFHHEERQYYNLERLWGDATQVPLQLPHEGL